MSSELKYECIICNAAFCAVEDFVDHSRKAHPKTEEESKNSHPKRKSRRTKSTLAGRKRLDKRRSFDLVPVGEAGMPKSIKVENKIKVEQASSEYPVKKEEDSLNLNCYMCNKTCTSQKALKRHVEYNHMVKPWKCSLCEKSFPTEAHKKIHEKLHSSQRPYECKECGKRFKSQTNLTCHTKTHSDLKPWKCVVCNMAFRAKSNFTKHSKMYHGGQIKAEMNEAASQDNSNIKSEVEDGTKENEVQHSKEGVVEESFV